jgi:hypothetical protein
MRWIAVVLGVGLILAGAVWTFQGYGTLKGSFMTGSRMWLWIGIACISRRRRGARHHVRHQPFVRSA